jgi:hypothetical protein
MLKLRRGSVVADDPLTVEVAGERRRAWADPALVGPTSSSAQAASTSCM